MHFWILYRKGAIQIINVIVIVNSNPKKPENFLWFEATGNWLVSEIKATDSSLMNWTCCLFTQHVCWIIKMPTEYDYANIGFEVFVSA